MLFKGDYGDAWATFGGPNEEYRYQLGRHGLSGYGGLLFVGLNPSTATHEVLDPTLKKVRHFANSWGYGRFEVVNLYGLRSTDPKGLWKVADPVGPENDNAIVESAMRAEVVLVGWGNNAKPERVERVLELLRGCPVKVVCLKKTKTGQPIHPLYQRNDSAPVLWR